MPACQSSDSLRRLLADYMTKKAAEALFPDLLPDQFDAEEVIRLYNVFEIVFVLAPTKTQEEEGVGATLLGGPYAIVARSQESAIAQASRKLSAENPENAEKLDSSLVSTQVRIFN